MSTEKNKWKSVLKSKIWKVAGSRKYISSIHHFCQTSKCPQREATLEPFHLFGRPNSIVRILCYLSMGGCVEGQQFPSKYLAEAPAVSHLKSPPNQCLKIDERIDKIKNLSERALKSSVEKKKLLCLMMRKAFNIQQGSDPALKGGQLGKQYVVVQCTHWCALMLDFQSRAVQFLKAPFVRGRILH